tara:strand:+ start:7090 stop:8988 length:1899 start_codon:yes stop_codon:yes gene_type:complete
MSAFSCLAQNLDNKNIQSKNDFKLAKKKLSRISIDGVPNHFSNYEKAIEYNLKALDWANNEESITDVIDTKSALLAMYMKLNMHSEAIVLAKNILTYPQVKNSRGSVDTMYALKETYRKSERFNDFLKILPMYYEACEKFGYPVTGGSVYENEIAYVHFSLNNYEKAISSYKKCVIEFKRKEEYLLQSSSFNDIGTCFKNLNKKDSAHFYFNKGLNIVKNLQSKSNYDEGYLNYFGNILKINVAETSPDIIPDATMISLYKNVIKDGVNTNELNIVIDAYYGLSKVFFRQNNSELTLKYIDSAEVVLKSYTYPKVKAAILELKVETYLLKGQSDKAKTYFKIYKKYSDSLSKVKIDKSFMNGILKYETNIKEKELEEVKKLIKSERKVILYQSIGIISLLFVFIFFGFIFIKIRRDTKIIKYQKFIVDKALTDNKVLIKEIHHRVKNNLQMVSSLFFLQSRKSKNANFKEILEQSQQQIQSMSLVHELLYEKDDIIDVNADKYIKKLINSLLTAYPNKKIELEISITNTTLHLDYANPIGLIINELVTNSIKHGFKGMNTGKISITLNKTKNAYEFEYSDNGIGIDKEIQTKKSNKTFGIRLIKSLVQEMNGTLEIDFNTKLKYKITFLDKK